MMANTSNSMESTIENQNRLNSAIGATVSRLNNRIDSAFEETPLQDSNLNIFAASLNENVDEDNNRSLCPKTYLRTKTSPSSSCTTKTSSKGSILRQDSCRSTSSDPGYGSESDNSNRDSAVFPDVFVDSSCCSSTSCSSASSSTSSSSFSPASTPDDDVDDASSKSSVGTNRISWQNDKKSYKISSNSIKLSSTSEENEIEYPAENPEIFQHEKLPSCCNYPVHDTPKPVNNRFRKRYQDHITNKNLPGVASANNINRTRDMIISSPEDEMNNLDEGKYIDDILKMLNDPNAFCQGSNGNSKSNAIAPDSLNTRIKPTPSSDATVPESVESGGEREDTSYRVVVWAPHRPTTAACCQDLPCCCSHVPRPVPRSVTRGGGRDCPIINEGDPKLGGGEPFASFISEGIQLRGERWGIGQGYCPRPPPQAGFSN